MLAYLLLYSFQHSSIGVVYPFFCCAPTLAGLPFILFSTRKSTGIIYNSLSTTSFRGTIMLFLPFLLFCSALAAPFTPDQDLTPSNRTNVFSDATTTGFEVHSILPRGTVLDVHPRAVEGSGPEKAGAVKAVANSKKTGTAKASTKATTKPNTKPDTKAKTKPDTKAKNKANTGKTSETSASNVHKASNTVSHSAAGKPVPVIVFPKPRADCGKFTKDVKDGKIKMNAVDIPPSIKGASSKVHQAVFWSGEMSEDEIRMYNQPVYGVSVQTDAMPEKPAEDLDTKTTAAHTSDNILKKPVKDSSAKTDAATEKSGGTGDVKSDRSGPRGRSLSDLQNRSDPVRQIDAPWELAMLSQLPGKPSRNYYYDKTAGAGVQIYYIDSGLNSQHDTVLKWRRLPEKPTLAFLAPSNHKGGTDQDSDGHGTCVWSKLVGWLGVAKAADVSVVASPYEFKSTMLRALNTVLWDAYRKYKARGVIKTAILSISVDSKLWPCPRSVDNRN